MAVKLLYIGGPLLDITAKCEKQYLAKYKLKPDDCVRIQDHQRSLFSELFQNPASFFSAGGSAQNSSRVSKWVLGHRGEVSFAGCVGKDEYASKLEAELKNIGVISLYSEHDTLSTGICACLLSEEGQRSMCTDLASAATYNLGHLNSNEESRRTLDESEIVFIAGYVLGHSPDVYKYVSEYCAKQEKIFATSLSAPYVCNVYAEDLKNCMPFIDIVFGNFDEAIILINKLWPDSGNNLGPEECARKIAQLPTKETRKRIVVITNGQNPLTVCHSDGNSKQWPIQKIDNVVDTVGCGDAFAGGFLATFALTKSVDEAVRCGINCAAYVAKSAGCTLSGDYSKIECVSQTIP